ncbi:uncharacterized protein M6B38_388560 [Iris pallida]|uniref:Ribosome maturation factor RimM n=1 Tax=Iris pallida TaxID=29817 RepID=A0AAX6G1F4_IRIPA|nr:uncharacterized protein M6B38_388560 [Iris pallida]
MELLLSPPSIPPITSVHFQQHFFLLSRPRAQLSHRRASAFSAAASCSWSPPSAVGEAAIDRPNQEEEEEEDDDEDEEEEDREEKEEGFVEVGYISKVHGLKGELRVKPTTDFPELRFSQPGRRWLRTRLYGKEVMSEVELSAGRSHPGQKSWIISLQGIDDVDKAKQIVGSTLLVRDEDRPELEEDEIYTPDLVGMRVLLKETGRLVGKVVNVFNFGASDLLQVLLESTEEELSHGNVSKPKVGASGQVVWVPFVEAIVPEIDMDRREMHITPPKGLLELNLRHDTRSKKERRQLEWKERKKLQNRMKAAKKKLCEMGQDHILGGLKVGEKDQKGLLARQIVNINFKLFQHVLQSIPASSDRFKLSEFISANSAKLVKNANRTSVKSLVSCEADDINYKYYKEGLQLLQKSKAAIVVLVNDEDSLEYARNPESNLRRLEELLATSKSTLEVEEQGIPVPLVVVSSASGIQSYEHLLLDNKYFGFDSEKVWLSEEEKLPIVSISSESNKVLMKSLWEILKAPTGSGGLFSLFSSNKILDNLIELGIEYIQICSLGERSNSLVIGNPLLFGFVESHRADMGVSMLEGRMEDNDEFDMVFSMRHLKKMCEEIDRVDFCAIPEKHAHVEVVKEGGEWVKQVHPIPDTPNSYRFHSSIYSALKKCNIDTICTMYVSE